MTERRKTRETTLLGLAPLLMFMVAASRKLVAPPGEIPLEIFYILMYLLLIAKAFTWWMDNPHYRVLSSEDYEFRNLQYQLAAGIAVGLAVTALILLFGRFQLPADPVGELTTQGLYVGFVETVFMIVVVQTTFLHIPTRRGWRLVNAGKWLWPPLFAFMHPPVRLEWIAGHFTLASFAAFGYGMFFALLFYLLWAGREGGGRLAPAFGAVTSWTAHVVINMVIVLFPLVIAGFEFYPM